jgi:hypothetical protein
MLLIFCLLYLPTVLADYCFNNMVIICLSNIHKIDKDVIEAIQDERLVNQDGVVTTSIIQYNCRLGTHRFNNNNDWYGMTIGTTGILPAQQVLDYLCK